MPARLLLGPYTGRQPDIKKHALGVTTNPMIESEPSKIAEFTSGAFFWNPSHYDAQAAWLASIQYLGGDAWPALKVFAENNQSSILAAEESPVLDRLLADFWQAWDSSSDVSTAIANLSGYFRLMAAAPNQLRVRMHNPAYLAQTKPWLDKLRLYGLAGEVATDFLVAQLSGSVAAAGKLRNLLEDLQQRIDLIPQVVAQGVMGPFLDHVVAVGGDSPTLGSRRSGRRHQHRQAGSSDS